MILVQVEVQRTWVVAKGAVNQLCSNVWYCIFFFGIVFISLLSIGLGGLQCICKDIDFKEVFYVGQFFQLYTTELLFLREKFSVSLIVMLGIPLQILLVTTVVECQSPKKAQIVAVDFTGPAVAIQGDQTMVLGKVSR